MVYNIEQDFFIIPIPDLIPLHHPLREGINQYQFSSDLWWFLTDGFDLPLLSGINIQVIDLYIW